MVRGRQRAWNRQCLLTAWSTYIIACTFGAFEHTDFEHFLDKYPPPGYVPPEEAKHDQRNRRRAVAAGRKR